MKQHESWAMDEVLDMPPLDWSIFRDLTLSELKKKGLI
jgi:hypothetical protein